MQEIQYKFTIITTFLFSSWRGMIKKKRRGTSTMSREPKANPQHGRKANQKMKPYLVMEYLMRNTDENHAAPADAIVEYLRDDLGIDAERRSIYRDIEEINKALWLLENANDDVTIFDAEEAIEDDENDAEKFIVYDKHLKGFRVVRRKYELSDIRLMAECIYASRYISQSEAERLVDIIKGFVSDEQAKEIRTDALVTTRQRTLNKSTLRNVSTIYDAMSKMIDGDKHTPEKISFQYLKYTIDDLEKQTERRKGAKYIVSPYKLIINDGNYYLLAFDENSQQIRTYRVDRMKAINRLGTPREGAEAFAAIDMKTYTQRTFSMFGGERERVSIRFVSSLLDTAVERFGRYNVSYSRSDDHHFNVSADVEISDQFFGWLCGFGTKAKLFSPNSIVEQYKEYLQKILSKY